MDHRKIIMNNLAEKHGRFNFYYSKVVDKIVTDQPNSRLVAMFKDYMIFDDSSCEFLKRFYTETESQQRIKELSTFYNELADIFPSYALILQPTEDEQTLILYNKEGMAKYLYKNIRRKQKVIDEKFSFMLKKQNKKTEELNQ